MASSVTLATLIYSLKVSVAAKTLSLYDNNVLMKTYPVATGTGGTPTPLGNFFLTELLAPTNSGYGPYAFGLSAFSEVLSSFGGGPGQIGLHGTDDAASIGRAVSHGCIRMTNDDITALAKLLPLGTPISIA
jgi:lipoprotein-anchoring transpeptidase ErfK/SrfK